MWDLGIDIAKIDFEAYLLDAQGKAFRFPRTKFPNTAQGFAQLLKALPEPEQTRVILEPTGVYSERAIEALDGKVAGVYEINPQVVRRRGHSMTQTKTDPADARSIARCGFEIVSCTPDELERFRVRFDPDLADLRLLQQERRRTMKAKARLLNQIENLRHSTAPIKDIILEERQEELERLKRRERELRRQIEQKASSVASEDADLIRSITGIGPITTAALVTRIRNIGRFKNADALKAYLGTYPRRRQSGKTEFPARMARHGDAYLKHALWNAAKSASRFNPVCRDYFKRLIDRGFSPVKAWGAIMRKLIQLVYGVLKNRTPFNPMIGVNPQVSA